MISPVSTFEFALLLLLALPFNGLSQNNGHTFFVKSYGGKCLDFGPPPQVTGAPVFLYDCNGTVAQQIRVFEPDTSPAGQHKVILFAGTKVIGVRKVALPPGIGATALELQDQSAFSPVQIFQLDGDSIISGDKRDLVVQVQNSLSANRTPLVLGPRELKDSEFWDFTAVDGSSIPPTSGFVRVPQDGKRLADALRNATFGSVIVLDGSFDLKVTGALPLILKSGVTLRSNRRFTNWGARLTWSENTVFDPGLDATCAAPALLDACASYTRVTGLRITGPSCTKAKANTGWIGIVVDDAYSSVIDHNELSCWTTAAVGSSNVTNQHINTPSPLLRPQPVHVVRNFIHHNEMVGEGYGVATGLGSFPWIQGNTFLVNRHAITGDPTPYTGYLASYNLVLSPVPGYKPGTFTEREQDFDMHGSIQAGGGPGCRHIEWCGGSAGQYIKIQGNTFLGTTLTWSRNAHLSFFLRGTPSFNATYQDNVVLQARDLAILNVGDADKLFVINNHFGSANPTAKLGVGDFDGDGMDDLFLATGAAWYYSPAGQVDWRFLNARTETLGTLLFGDFDGDGRTDVFKQQGRNWLVSWGGISPWEKINESDAQFADLAVGDFDGDGRSDIFYSDGRNWFVSSGGTGPLTPFQTSSFRVRNLRFGDFDHDLKTDVFGIVSGSWQVSYGAKSSWTRLRHKLTDSVVGLMVADFDGDGKDDIAIRENGSLKVSSGGTGDWMTFSTSPLSVAAFGRFQIRAKRIDRRKARADLLVWENNYLDILPGGKQPTTRHNPEEMR